MTATMASQVPVWQRSVPAVLSPLLPAMPMSDNVLADMNAVYEYKVLHLESAEGNIRAIVLVRIAIPSSENNNRNGSQKKEIRPMLFAHDLRSRSNVQWIQSNAANPVLRFQDEVAYMLHDRRYRCEGSPTCLASMRIRAWAHVSEIPPRDASKAPRTCAHCGRKGHRKQSCCEAPGNCRLEIEWMHDHPVVPPVQNSSSSIPIPAEVDSCAPPPPGISISLGSGDLVMALNSGAKRSMSSMETFGNTRNTRNSHNNHGHWLVNSKKSRPSSGASSVFPFAPSTVNASPASCGGGKGCPCEGARAMRGRCAEKLRFAEDALRDLTNTLSGLASMHDQLSRRAQTQAGTICSIEQLTQQRDALRTEVDGLWAQRNALLGDIPKSNNNVNANNSNSKGENALSTAAQPPPCLRRLSSAKLSTSVSIQQSGAPTPRLSAPLPSHGVPAIVTPIPPRMVPLGAQLEGHSERIPVNSRGDEVESAGPLVTVARGTNEVNTENVKRSQENTNPNTRIIEEVRNEESPVSINVNTNDDGRHKIRLEQRATTDDKVEVVGKVDSVGEKDKSYKAKEVGEAASEELRDAATFGLASAQPIECGNNTETEEKFKSGGAPPPLP